MEQIGKLIVSIATKYIGKTEKPGNAGFNDADFEKKMVACGWLKSQAWCAYFCELVWKEAYSTYLITFIPLLEKLFSGGALQTLANFKAKNYIISQVPVVGALAVWKHGIDPKDYRGHIAIVCELKGLDFKCIEGNTNDKGGREGYIVAPQPRKLDFTKKAGRLNLIGFIHPNIIHND